MSREWKSTRSSSSRWLVLHSKTTTMAYCLLKWKYKNFSISHSTIVRHHSLESAKKIHFHSHKSVSLETFWYSLLIYIISQSWVEREREGEIQICSTNSHPRRSMCVGEIDVCSNNLFWEMKKINFLRFATNVETGIWTMRTRQIAEHVARTR